VDLSYYTVCQKRPPIIFLNNSQKLTDFDIPETRIPPRSADADADQQEILRIADFHGRDGWIIDCSWAVCKLTDLAGTVSRSADAVVLTDALYASHTRRRDHAAHALYFSETQPRPDALDTPRSGCLQWAPVCRVR